VWNPPTCPDILQGEIADHVVLDFARTIDADADLKHVLDAIFILAEEKDRACVAGGAQRSRVTESTVREQT
jgi:hypothetical protein